MVETGATGARDGLGIPVPCEEMGYILGDLLNGLTSWQVGGVRQGCLTGASSSEPSDLRF